MSQYHDTQCLICHTTIHAPVESFVCGTCHNDDHSTVADFIVKQNSRIAALEAQNARLVEALAKEYSNYHDRHHSNLTLFVDCIRVDCVNARTLLAEVTQ